MKFGLYRINVAEKKFPTDQRHMGEYHTDGFEFYYLNSEDNWVDIGWGFPYDWDKHKLELMTPAYAELSEYGQYAGTSMAGGIPLSDTLTTWRDVSTDIKEWVEHKL